MKQSTLIVLGGAAVGLAALALLVKKLTGTQIENTTKVPDNVTSSKIPVIGYNFSELQVEPLTNGNALSQRSNNPGAVFWNGTDNWQGMDKSKTKKNAIIYFDSSDYGVRACCKVLKNYKKLHGIDNLFDVFSRYAPKGHSSNDPASYASLIAQKVGISSTTKIDLENDSSLLAAVAYHIQSVEAGYYWIPRTKYLDYAKRV